MLASTRQFQSPANSAPMVCGSEVKFTSGGVRLLLRLEGFAAFAVSVALYARAGFSWPVFALLFLAPDLSMLGYLTGPRAGAAVYNFVHTYALALPLALAGFFAALPTLTATGLILIAHIGFDRTLGYGLKYSSAFGDTHLSRIGRR
jgi:ABC-type Co2+ transport system permease subunit